MRLLLLFLRDKFIQVFKNYLCYCWLEIVCCSSLVQPQSVFIRESYCSLSSQFQLYSVNLITLCFFGPSLSFALMLVSFYCNFFSFSIEMFNSLCLGFGCCISSWLQSLVEEFFTFLPILLLIEKLFCGLPSPSLCFILSFMASNRYCFSVSIFLSYSMLFLFTILFIFSFSRITSRFCQALSLLSSFFISLIQSTFFCYYFYYLILLNYSFFLRSICLPNRFYCSLWTFQMKSRAFLARSASSLNG